GTDNVFPIRKDRITRLMFLARGDVYVDKLELVKVKKITADNAFAFNFHKKGHVRQAQYIDIEGETAYSEETGYGFDGGRAFGLGKATPYPTPLMGTGLDWRDLTFCVDLPGGKYVGWVVFQRSGFWGDESAMYEAAALEINGLVVHQHTIPLDRPFFLFQDREVMTQDGVVAMVLEREGTADIAFEAVNGKNQFCLKTGGVKGYNLRVAGLIIAPDTDEGRAFVGAHRDLQTSMIAGTHRVTKRDDRIGDPAEAKTPILVLPLASDHMMFPADWPDVTESRDIPPMHTYAGLQAIRLIGLYAVKPYSLTASLSPLTGPGGDIPANAVKVQWNHYMPMRNYETAACWIETIDYRPAEPVSAGPSLARALLVRVFVPDATPAGTYEGLLELHAVNTRVNKPALTVRAPISVVVHPGVLPAIDFPNSLFSSAVAIPRSVLSEDVYWMINEDLVRQLALAGKNFLTAGPNFKLRWEGDTAVVEGSEAVRMIDIGKKYGMDILISNYGGLSMPLRRIQAHGSLSREQTAKAIFEAFEKFRGENGVPDYVYYAFDEPNKGFDAIIENLRLLRGAGFRTIGYTSLADPETADENHLALAKESTDPAFNAHSKETLAYVRGLGNRPWVYNNGIDRYSQGVHTWRNHRYGAEGRIDWIAAIIQGYQFDMLDGREPDRSCFYFHSEHGALPSPRYMGVIEGGLDARLLFELERRTAANPASPVSRGIVSLFEELEAAPYRGRIAWDDMERLRERMMSLIDESGE
ncbi:hypothetical protein ACFLSJ_07875, partial [Verrucomicrobiota bacterium]